jgi:hypothetical protein
LHETQNLTLRVWRSAPPQFGAQLRDEQFKIGRIAPWVGHVVVPIGASMRYRFWTKAGQLENVAARADHSAVRRFVNQVDAQFAQWATTDDPIVNLERLDCRFFEQKHPSAVAFGAANCVSAFVNRSK